MKYKIIVLSLFSVFAVIGVSQEETPVSNFKGNIIQLEYSAMYFFDNILPNPAKHAFNFGLCYEHYRPTAKLGWHGSVQGYWYNAELPSPIYLGSTLERQVIFFSIGLDKQLISRQNLRLNWFGEFNHRLGNDAVYGGGSGISFTYIRRKLIDFGLSIGSNLTYRFPFGMTTSISVKQSFYYFRFDRGHETWTFEDGTPRNVISLSLGIGWNFGLKKDQDN
ncbi:MAG: hypothetical protein R2780_12095 [Crocinitomicaceae bacterium]